MEDLTRDPRPDRELGAALRALDGDLPFSEEDRKRLHGRIAARAELPLARLRRSRARRATLRALLPAAAAAGVAAFVLLAGGLPGRAPTAGEPTGEALVELIVQESLPEQVGLYLSGEAIDVALLEAAIGS